MSKLKMTSNRYKVAKRVWSKWSKIKRHVFNDVYSSMVGCQRNYLHPSAESVPKKHWETTAWNAAWIAGDCANAASIELSGASPK